MEAIIAKVLLEAVLGVIVSSALSALIDGEEITDDTVLVEGIFISGQCQYNYEGEVEQAVFCFRETNPGMVVEGEHLTVSANGLGNAEVYTGNGIFEITGLNGLTFNYQGYTGLSSRPYIQVGRNYFPSYYADGSSSGSGCANLVSVQATNSEYVKGLYSNAVHYPSDKNLTYSDLVIDGVEDLNQRFDIDLSPEDFPDLGEMLDIIEGTTDPDTSYPDFGIDYNEIMSPEEFYGVLETETYYLAELDVNDPELSLDSIPELGELPAEIVSGMSGLGSFYESSLSAVGVLPVFAVIAVLVFFIRVFKG